MPLAYQLDSLEGLEESQKQLYKEQDGKYVLDVEGVPQGGDEDVQGLKKKVDELLDEKKRESEKAREAEEKARKEAEERARKEGDYKTLTEQLEQKNKELEERLDKQAQEVGERERQRVAMETAAQLAEGPNQKILARFIEDRLRYEDGEVKVTDQQGNLTISTLDDLKQEFANSQEFASVVVGSRASGGGASGQGDGGGAAEKKLSDMTEQEQLELYRKDPDEYRRLRDAEQSE